jgi:hypothetical protein
MLEALASPDLRVTPACHSLRVRHVRKAKLDWYMLFNEAAEAIDVTVEAGAFGTIRLIDPYSDIVLPFDGRLHLSGHEMRVLVCEPEGER